MAEMLDVAEDTRDLIYTLDGVQFQILGAQQGQIYLEFEPLKISSLRPYPEQVFGALAQQNIIEPGGGQISAAERMITLEPSGNYETVAEIAATVFEIPGTGRVQRLDEVVNIVRGYADPPVFQRSSMTNLPPILSVSTLEGTNNIAFGEALTELQEPMAVGVADQLRLDYATFQPTLIETAVQGAVSNVYQTLAIVLAVVMDFPSGFGRA